MPAVEAHPPQPPPGLGSFIQQPKLRQEGSGRAQLAGLGDSTQLRVFKEPQVMVS